MTDQATIISDITRKQQQQLLQQQQESQQQLSQQPQQQQHEQQSHDHHMESYHASPPQGVQKDEKGYTVVPASVSFRGVSMKLDLKIDQKTLAAATNFSKFVEEAVSTHLSSSVVPVENDKVGNSLITHIPPSSTTVAQPFYSVSSFTVMEPANSTKESPICDSSVESSTAFLGKDELCEQVNEVCSSTIDASPFCDTACSPIQLELQTKLPQSVMNNYVKSSHDTLPASSEEQNRIAPHPSVKEELTSFVATAAPEVYLTPCASTSSAEVDATQFSPVLAKRRKEKTTTASHLCEQIDPEKGQCRQRAIVNYRYCIRHILLDPDAPYIQCQHQRKPKSKRDTNLLCTNAVRKDKGTIYCSTHLIMNGLMEPRKKKAKAGAVIVESTELTSLSNNNLWNLSVIPRKANLTTALSQAVVGTEEEINCKSRSVEQTSIRNDGVVYNSVMNSAVVAVDSIGNKRALYQQVSKISGASALPAAKESRNEMTTFNDGTSIEDDEYTGLPKLPMHKTVMPLPISSSYSGIRSTYESPVEATASQVRRNLPQLYSRTASHVVPPALVKTCDGAQISCTQAKIVKQRATPNLSKQHPQLAAKLLQAPPSTAGQSAVSSIQGAPIRSNFAKSIFPSSLLVSQPRNLLPSAAPRLASHSEPPRFYKIPYDDKIKSTVKQEQNDVQKPKVIQLKQKRRRLKMTGIYRKIPQVDQMCRVLEDQDFDRTDLFPRGLEPSDDEDEENDYLDLRWSEMACNAVSGPQGALQVYLVKKQIRLDKNALMKEAVTNAPIMHACKQYPNSVGAALADRASNYGTAPSAIFNQKKCAITILKNGSPPVQCMNNCLPFSNHCAQHISYNLNQKLFSYCAEPCCSQPVLCVDAPKTLKLCAHHYELRKKKKVDEGIARENTHQSWKQQTPICYVQQQQLMHQQYDDDVHMNIQHSYYPSQDIGPDRLNSGGVSDFGELEMGSASSGNESDVYLASFAKDLEFNFDGREINDMLANFNVVDGEGPDILHDQPFSDGTKDEFLQIPTEFTELAGGHNWLDVEQFLISEGVDLSSSSQSSNLSTISVPQSLGLTSDRATFCEFPSSYEPRS